MGINNFFNFLNYKFIEFNLREMKEVNEANQTLLDSLEKRGLLEMTKAYFRTSLLETLKKDDLYNTAPSGFNIKSNQINDQSIINIIRLQYSLINDFLIRTKLNYTQNIFNNEIRTLIDSPIPFTDSELVHNLNLSAKQISTLRLNSNINTSPKDFVKSTYLYQLINRNCSLIKKDNEAQTMQIPEGDIKFLSPNVKNSLIEKKTTIDLEKEMKKIDDKYNNKYLDNVLPFNKINEKKFFEYKEECDKRYEENLKNEMDRFKNIELCNMRLEEKKKYDDKIESIREEYKNIYDKKYEEIKKLKNELRERKSNMEKEYEKKMLDLNLSISEKLKNLREENNRNNNKYILEINNLNKEKNNLEQTIENLKDMHYNEMQSQIQKMKNEYQAQLETEKSILKEENNRNQKILQNNYIKNNNEINQIKKQINNIKPIEKNSSKVELAPLKNTNINYLKNADLINKITEDTQNRKKKMEELEEEQLKLNKLMKYEFNNIMNDETPIVLINQDEIDQIKRNGDYYNNIIMNEKKEAQRKKSIDDLHYNNNYKDSISPNKNKQQSISPIGNKNNINNKYLNNSVLNNSKNMNLNTSMRNSNIGIAGANYNNIYQNKVNSGVIEENIEFDNISSSQKSKEHSKKKESFNNYNNININNNIQSTVNNQNISRPSQINILPPINQNQTNYSIKEDIEGSGSKNKSKMGSSGKKNNDLNNNAFNKSNKFNNINYDKNDEDDEYGDGDFENNISSMNQNSEMNTTRKKSNNFGRIKNQNEASMSIQEKIDKQNQIGTNDKEPSDSYNDFENTKDLAKKGINEGSINYNNMSRYKNSNNKYNKEEEIKEEIEIDYDS